MHLGRLSRLQYQVGGIVGTVQQQILYLGYSTMMKKKLNYPLELLSVADRQMP